eukprot:6190968-Pleurochrysis_carterae.AAC.2
MSSGQRQKRKRSVWSILASLTGHIFPYMRRTIRKWSFVMPNSPSEGGGRRSFGRHLSCHMSPTGKRG